MSDTEILLDESRLTQWLERQGLLEASSIKAERLTGGRSNEMFTIANGDKSWVLRRPAGVAWEKTELGLIREYRLLNAIKNSGVAIPQPIAVCEDRDIIGAAFYLMEKVEGFMPALEIPVEFTSNQETRNLLARAGIDALAALHRVDWQAVGLSDFGRPSDFHQRQVSRWLKQLASYQGRELPELDRIGDWLEAHIPVQWKPTLMHGDYHPLNMLIAPQLPPRVAAIVDWETATIGDPFLDVVGYLDIWFDANGQHQWPAYDALLAHYLSQVDFVPENFDYYRLLYYFRMAVLLEGIYQRSMQDETREIQHGVGDHVDRLIVKAVQVLADVGDADE